MPRKPNLALHLPQYSVQDKNGLYILNSWEKKIKRVFYDIWDMWNSTFSVREV